MDNNQKRRVHRRIDVSAGLLKTPGFDALNLSESGMGLTSSTTQPKGKKLDLLLNLGGEEISVSAEVMWCRQSNSVFDQSYHVGVRFLNHSASQLLRLRQFIDAR